MTLQLYILRQLAIAIGFSIAGISLVVVPTILISAIHRLGPVGLPAVFAFLPLVLVDLVPFLLPMAYLLGVVATYGRLAADRELIAVRMAGIHPARLTLPAILIGVVFSVWTYHLVSSVSPDWKYASRNYERHQAVEAFKNFAEGSGDLEFGNSSLTSRSGYGNVREGVLLDLREEEGKEMTVTADSAKLSIRYDEALDDDVLVIEFTNARVLGDGARIFGEAPFCSFPLKELFPFYPKDRRRAKYLVSAEIRETLADDTIDEDVRRGFLYEIHRRTTLSLTYLLFLLIGIPTGIMFRSSTQLGAITGSLGAGLVYFVLALQLGKTLSKSGALSPILAAWLPTAVFFVIGAVLSYRALFR